MATREAMLYRKMPGVRSQCNVCQWRCVINPDKLGVCRMRRNTGGTIYTLNYGQVSSVAADPIEKKPLFHFHPDTLAFSLGGWGCNFHCQGCQNWEISCVDIVQPEYSSRTIPPEQAIEMAKKECGATRAKVVMYHRPWGYRANAYASLGAALYEMVFAE